MDIKEPEVTMKPEDRELVRKMRAFSMVSIGIMCLGIMTFLSVIVYRVVKPKDTETVIVETISSEPAVAARVFPQGSRIIQLAPYQGRVYVAIENAEGQHEIQVLNANTLQPETGKAP